MRFRPAFALLLVTLGACTSWQHQSAPAPQVVAAQNGQAVRVVRRDGSVYELHNAIMANDSIVGWGEGNPRARVSVPLAEVERIDARRVSVARTAGLAAGLTVVALAVIVPLLAGFTLFAD
jgi:hypothetical protein